MEELNSSLDFTYIFSSSSTFSTSQEEIQLSVLELSSSHCNFCSLTVFESSSAAGLMYPCSAVLTAQDGNFTAQYCLHVHYHTVRAAF